MKTDDPDTREGDGGDDDGGTVIRLPRDWLGPPEELVPMGSGAGRREAVARSRATLAPPTDTELDDEADEIGSSAQPTGAHDFWGAGAAALHHPMQAPVEDRPTAVHDHRPTGAPDQRRPAAIQGPAPTPKRPRTLHRRRTRVGTLAALLAASALALVAATGWLGHASHRAVRASASTSEPSPRRAQQQPTSVIRESTVGQRRAPIRSRRARRSHTRARTRTGTRHAQRTTPTRQTHPATPTTATATPEVPSQTATTSSAPVTSQSDSAADSTATAASSRRSTSPTGGASAGPTGVGSASTSCNPKCG